MYLASQFISQAGEGLVRRRALPFLLRAAVEGKAHAEARAPALGALDGNVAGVLLHDLAHTGEADPRAADLPRHVGAAEEALEHLRQVVGGDAHPLVLHLEHSARLPPLAFQPYLHDDRAAVRAVLDRVREQVAGHTADTHR